MNAEKNLITNRITSQWRFRLFMLKSLPMGLLAGIRVIELNEYRCITSVPYKWLNKNPFKSIYFAVLSMAAELSTAAPCMINIAGTKPSIAFIIVDVKAVFLKKSTSRVYFECHTEKDFHNHLELVKSTNEAQKITLKTVGKMKDGTKVAEFEFTWSMKKRSS